MSVGGCPDEYGPVANLKKCDKGVGAVRQFQPEVWRMAKGSANVNRISNWGKIKRPGTRKRGDNEVICQVGSGQS